MKNLHGSRTARPGAIGDAFKQTTGKLIWVKLVYITFCMESVMHNDAEIHNAHALVYLSLKRL